MSTLKIELNRPKNQLIVAAAGRDQPIVEWDERCLYTLMRVRAKSTCDFASLERSLDELW